MEIHSYVEIKQHATDQPMGQRRNQQNALREIKWKYNITKIQQIQQQQNKNNKIKVILRGTSRNQILKKLTNFTP